MRTLFPGYFRPTDDQFNQIWAEGIFTFDTNILLNVYRYTTQTQASLFQILDRLEDRIWIPNQVAKEYLERRLEVISKQFKTYQEVERLFDDALGKLENQLRQFERHPLIDAHQLIALVHVCSNNSKSVLNELKQKHPNLLEKDDLLTRITQLFDEDKVGHPYSSEMLAKVHSEGAERYKKEQPPGYKDLDKSGVRQYGDYVLWCQLKDHAKSQQRPLIFVTGDAKEDWWLRHEGKTIGPRPELIEEMAREANVAFYMYQDDQFRSFAQQYLGDLPDQQTAIDEVREVSSLNQAIADLMSTLLFGKDEFTRRDAAYQLGLRDVGAAVPALIKALTDESFLVRGEAAESLGKLRDTAAVPALVLALTDETSSVRGKAAQALGEIKDPGAATELVKSLYDEPFVRGHSARALGKVRDVIAIPELTRLLRDKDSHVRGEAADALGAFGVLAAAAVPALGELLSDTNLQFGEIRVCDLALGALRRIRTPEALEILKSYDETT